ncbi:MAG: aspartate kinase [Robiginitomaculum sp.]|nr:MAG: aspartate kinase [Robiginitomaculum sp.]
MTRLVMKFGGTSSADPSRLEACAALIAARQQDGAKIAVVVSAPAGLTDQLGRDVAHADPRGEWADEGDAVLAAGEQINAALLAMALRRLGLRARSFTGWQAGILSDGAHGNAKIQTIASDHLAEVIDGGTIAVIAGFQGLGPDGRITTLGRGGSDLSAVALAATLGAQACEIYTDVEGVYSADPRMVPTAKPIARLSYEELLEMASQGTKVMQSRSVELAMAKTVTLRILSSFEGKVPKTGTTISTHAALERASVCAISYSRDETRIMVHRLPTGSEALKRVFAVLADAGLQVDLIVQSPGNRVNESTLVFSLRRGDAEQALALLTDPCHKLALDEVSMNPDMAKVSVIGIGLRSQTRMAHTMFETLCTHDIAIGAVATSETRISVLIPASDVEIAVRALHRAFELDQPQT